MDVEHINLIDGLVTRNPPNEHCKGQKSYSQMGLVMSKTQFSPKNLFARKFTIIYICRNSMLKVRIYIIV